MEAYVPEVILQLNVHLRNIVFRSGKQSIVFNVRVMRQSVAANLRDISAGLMA